MNKIINVVQFSSVQSLSHVQLLATPWITACQASLSFINFRSSLNSCPLSGWYHPAISSSVVPFSSHPQPFPASGSFPMSQFFISGGQTIGASALALVLPKSLQDWFPLGWTGWISLQPKGLSSLLQHHSSKGSALWHSGSFIGQLSHPCMTPGKTIALAIWAFVRKVMSLLFNTLSRLIITFLLKETITLKSNPIPAEWVTHQLKNSNTREVPLLQRF